MTVPSDAAGGAPVSVMLVDDEPALVATLLRVFQRATTEVRTATSVNGALTLVRAQIPDLVVSGYRMPVSKNGLDLLERIHADHPQVTCVLHTGGLAPEASRQHPFRVLTKPCPTETMLELVDLVRAGRGSRG